MNNADRHNDKFLLHFLGNNIKPQQYTRLGRNYDAFKVNKVDTKRMMHNVPVNSMDFYDDGFADTIDLPRYGERPLDTDSSSRRNFTKYYSIDDENL